MGPEAQDNQDLFDLTPKDQGWLDSYGVDPAWQNDAALRQSLNELIVIGSLRLDESVNQDRWQEIVSARISFFNFVGMTDDFIEDYQLNHPTIIPLDTFIGTQRVMNSLDLDAARIVNALPATISYAPESVREKMANLTALGLDAARVVNASPATISYAPESVREKMANLTALGLDAARVVNASPAAIHYAPESVREKMLFLRRSARLLQWQNPAEELVNAFPALLGYSTKKLAILRHIAARHVDSTERTSIPFMLQSKLMVPLEKYIIALSRLEDDQVPSLSELSKKAYDIKLDSSGRKELAAEVAPKMGRIGTMYLVYRSRAAR